VLLSYASAQYCSSGPIYLSDTNLGPVRIAGDGKTIDDTTDCPRVAGPRDLTTQSVDITAGGLYSIMFSVTACGIVYGSTIGAWIDYNHNYVFEPTENLFFRTFIGSGSNISAEFVVPANVSYYGSTRLRVQLQETSVTQTNPCANFSYGGTKDFSVVTKKQSPYCTAGPTSPEDTHLGPLILQGEKRDLIQYAEPCPGFLGPTNFSDILADVKPGNSYPLALSVVTCRKQYPNILTSMWVDWNGDYIWDESERTLPVTSKFGAIMHTLVVPSNAKAGNTAARVMVQETTASTIEACDETFKYGATQDYVINIM